MNYIVNCFLILTLLVGFAFSQTQKKIKKNKPLIVKTENDKVFSKEWEKKNKNIKDPELLKLIEILRQEFSRESESLKKEFRLRTKELKKKYTEKRKNMVKTYRKEKRSTINNKKNNY